jgi:hypothetical protein
MELHELVETINTRQDLAEFIQALLRDLETNQQEWGNSQLERYLDALAAWAKDMDGYFRNIHGHPAPEQPTWRLIGRMLMVARIYE